MSAKRKKILISILLLLILSIVAPAYLYKYAAVEKFKTAFGISGRLPAHAQDQKKGKYYCPMHPSYVSDKPDNCPICQMKLVPMGQAQSDNKQMKDMPMPTQTGQPAGAQTKETPSGGQTGPPTGGQMKDMPMPAGHPGAQSMPPGLGPVTISPQRQQLIGVAMEEARVQPLKKTIRTVGMVAIDERRIAEIHTKISGWAEKVYVDATWQHVRQGEPLIEIYSPELVQTQEEYLLALRTRDSLAKSSFREISSGGDSLLEAARRRLRLWDITEEQIRELEKRGQAKKTMTIYSPMTGHVTQRDVFPSKRVEPNMKLYTIVDHSVVWVNVDFYENEISFLKVGQIVRMTTIAYPGEVFRAKVSLIWPHLEEKTRTVKARLEFENPKLLLKPDMYANVELEVPLGRQLTVPEDAVLNTGTQQYVFVDKGDGYFEPREVKLGPQAEARYVIRRGLKAGERVVTAANFLLDSESRLRGAFVSMGPPQKAPSTAEKAAEALRIQLRTEPDPAKVGNNTVRVTVADAKGSPITDASVRVTISMPAMGSMPPMNSEARLSPKGNGEYAGTLNIPMAWTWQAVVTVERRGQVLGTYQSNITAK